MLTARVALAASLVAACASTASAQQAHVFAISGNLPSNGQAPPHSSQIYNGVFYYTASAFQVGDIKIQGTVASGGIGSWGSELRYRAISPNGQVFDSVNVYVLNNSWTGNLSVNNTQDGSALGLASAGTWEFRLYESYDDSGAAVDAVWISVTISIYQAPPDSPYELVAALGPDDSVVIDTYGSDYDTVLALYDSLGNLMDVNDNSGGGVQSELIMAPAAYPPGRYYIAVGGTGTDFQDDWSATPGDAGGSLLLNHYSGSETSRTHPDAVVWYALDLSIAEPDCPSDIDGDGDVDLTDLATLLAAYGTSCP
jgi:hypothetical protein